MKLRYRIGTRVIYWVWRFLFGFRVDGRENIPKDGGVIIAPNHLSNFDPPLVGTAVWFRECYFFAKQELFTTNKFFAWFIKGFNAYKVNTKRPSKNVLNYTQGLLNKGIAVMFFPEGTRSKVGSFLRFNPGVGWFALKCGVPIVPTLVKGTNTPLIKQFIRKSRAYVKFGLPITSESISGIKQGKEARELMTQEVEHRIEELYESATCT
ncbi:MAG: lysophospholipid acyltransferase family protein [bacterium]|nr:lysophospholipid acyltransferase family protein [bacterium]